MKPYNRTLILSIRTFFQVAFVILLTLIFIYTVLGGIQIFFPGIIEGIGMPFFFVSENPNVSISINGKDYETMALAGQGMIVLKDSPVLIPVINYLSSLTVLVFYLFIVRNVKMVIKSLKTSDVFTSVNAGRLRKIAFLMLSSYVLNLIYQLMFNLYLKKSFDSSDFMLADWFVMDYQVGLVVSIVFMFFISSVFKVGTDISDENKSFI